MNNKTGTEILLAEQVRELIEQRRKQLASGLNKSPNIDPTPEEIQKVHDAILSDPYIKELQNQLAKIEIMKGPQPLVITRPE